VIRVERDGFSLAANESNRVIEPIYSNRKARYTRHYPALPAWTRY